MTVAIIDYGSGNLRSAAKAFERAAAEAGLAANVVVTSDPTIVEKADRIVLPGVGAFADCRRGLDSLPRMTEILENAVHDQKKPFLGICVGMQLMARRGFEHGATEGFGWIDSEVVALSPKGAESPAGTGYRVPHMGWNELAFTNAHPVFEGFNSGSHAYFVHSFHMECEDPADVIATANYGQAVTAVVGKDNMIGTQFHPEKSQSFGLKFIGNFLAWTPDVK